MQLFAPDSVRRFSCGSVLCRCDSFNRLSRARRSFSSLALSARRVELVPECVATAEEGVDPRSTTWTESEERELIDVAGDELAFEAAMARARSA